MRRSRASTRVLQFIVTLVIDKGKWNMERIVVVGCGSIGLRHASQLMNRNDVAVELCDVSEENISRVCDAIGSVPVHRSFEEMLKTRPAMLVVATPPTLHEDQTVAALNAGIHVLCEKPMSGTLEGARRMLATAKTSDCILDVGFVLRFHPGLRAIKKEIEDGRLGRVLHVHWHIGTYETLLRSVSRHQASTFGALALDYAHQPDLLYCWLGRNPVRVYATGFESGDLKLSSKPNVMTLTLEYESDLLATINLNFVQQPGRAHCEVIGDKGWAYFDMTSGTMQIGEFDRSSVETVNFANDRDALFRDEHQTFVDAVHGRCPPESPALSAIQSMLVVEAAIRSLRSGQPETVAAV